ncbi:MAG: hypothetical protein ACOCXA_02725 [Planctomycetota bacterium]
MTPRPICPLCLNPHGLRLAWQVLIAFGRDHEPPERIRCQHCQASLHLRDGSRLRRDLLISWSSIAVTILITVIINLIVAGPWPEALALLYLATLWWWCGRCTRRHLHVYGPPDAKGSDDARNPRSRAAAASEAASG